MEFVTLNNLKINGSTILCKISCPLKFEKYLRNKDALLKVEYPKKYDLISVPKGMLYVAFVGQILPCSMLLGIGIKVECLDESFYNSLPKIKKAYKHLYPWLSTCFDVQAEYLEKCSYETKGRSSLFFTGGLDATSAMVSVIKEKPTLVNIAGGDIVLADTDSHNALESYFTKLTSELGNDFAFIKSNCRFMYNGDLLTKLCDRKLLPFFNHGWWAGIAHILSMVTQFAPLAYILKIEKHYIGSSYDSRGWIHDANNDEMLDAIKFASCTLVPVDSLLGRTEKAAKVIDFSQKNKVHFELKVCWQRKASQNCGLCEKCYRTILDILANNGNPNDYGFSVNEKTYDSMKIFLENNYVNHSFWTDIQNSFKKNDNLWKNDKRINWFLDLKINNKKIIVKKTLQVLRRRLKK